MSQLVLVIGVGRSGTSAFVGIIRELGFQVPQPEVRPDATNPRGFGEPRWVVDFHRRLLKERRITAIDSRPAAWEQTAETAEMDQVVDELRSWLEVQCVGAERVVVKDPRIVWFLPLWRRAAADLGVRIGFATMLRPPPEVLRSARQWYGDWQADANRAAGWVNIMTRTELQSRGDPRVFVRYDEMLADWPAQMRRVGERLDAPGLVQPSDAGRAAVDSWIEPGLRRQTRGWEELEVPAAVRDMVDRTWNALLPFAADGPEPGTDVLDGLRAEYDEYYAEAEAVVQSSIRAARRRRKRSAPEPGDESEDSGAGTA